MLVVTTTGRQVFWPLPLSYLLVRQVRGSVQKPKRPSTTAGHGFDGPAAKAVDPDAESQSGVKKKLSCQPECVSFLEAQRTRLWMRIASECAQVPPSCALQEDGTSGTAGYVQRP